MFVPRVLRLKGQQEPPNNSHAASTRTHIPDDRQNSVVVTQNTSANEHELTLKNPDIKPAAKGSRFPTTPITPEFLAQLVAGMELIFTDYAHQQPKNAKWLQCRYRTVDGEHKYIHLSAILEHDIIKVLKPQPTQILLRKALQEITADSLELSQNGFYVRRKPSTYPLTWVPHNSFSVTNDDGLSFWDQRTIYVEPHIRHLSKTPAKVAHWLKEHGELKAKWLPVQAVHTLYNSCAFVVLSGNVLHGDVWGKWREGGKPEDWKIMTKVEHTKRTDEYLELLRKNKAYIKRPHDPPFDIEATKALGGDAVQDSEAAGDHPPRETKRLKLRNYPLEL